MPVDRNWFKTRLRELGKTQNDLADALATTASTLSRILDLKRDVKPAELRRLAEFLLVPSSVLYAYFGIEAERGRRMALSGYVYDNGVVRPDLDASAADAQRFRNVADVRRPADFGGEHAFLVVETGNLPFFEPGDVLYCAAPQNGNLAAFNGRECVVTVRGGQRFLRKIERVGPASWALVSRTGQVVADARIVEAFAVELLWHAGAGEP